jgi:hypothetical protein
LYKREEGSKKFHTCCVVSAGVHDDPVVRAEIHIKRSNYQHLSVDKAQFMELKLRHTCTGHYAMNWWETNSKMAYISKQIKIAKMFTPVCYTSEKITKYT